MSKQTICMSSALAVVVAAATLGIVGCGGGKDAPTSVALRPPKVQTGGGGTNAGGGTEENDGGSTAPAEGFGSITGRVVIAEGDRANVRPPDVKLYDVGNAPVDPSVCASKMPIIDQSLIVDSSNGGIKNVFVYLEKKPTGGKEKIASQGEFWPTASEGMEGKLLLDQKNCTFAPHAMVVYADQSFLVNSQDPVSHTFKAKPRYSTEFNIPTPTGGAKEVNVYSRAEKTPVPISCATHNWMQGFQLPLDHPYAAVTKADGTFTISDLPSGEHEFVIWHEKGYKTEETFTVVADQDTNVGEIIINLSQLK